MDLNWNDPQISQTIKIMCHLSWNTSSCVGRVPALQAWGLELSQPTWKYRLWWHMPGTQKQEDPWGSLASQGCPAQRRTEKNSWGPTSKVKLDSTLVCFLFLSPGLQFKHVVSGEMCQAQCFGDGGNGKVCVPQAGKLYWVPSLI